MVTHVHVYHILVKTEQEADSILNEINKGMDFQKMAQLKSICPSGKNGGDLGWFSRGAMVKEFEKAAFELEKGQMTIKPVKTQFGWHLIKVVDKR